MLFFIRGEWKSKQMWGYFPSTTDGKKHADATFHPCGRKSMYSKRYFPSPATED